MGACASKFWKGAAGNALPEEVASRNVSLGEQIDQKDEAVPVGDESKRQLLGNLFKEREGKDGTKENGGKISEVVKQEDGLKDMSRENENVESSEPVSGAPAKDADTVIECLILKTEDDNLVKPGSEQTVEHKAALEKEAEEELGEQTEFGTPLTEKHEECKQALETGKNLVEETMVETSDTDKYGRQNPVDKKETEEVLVETRNLETPDTEKIEDQKPDSAVEKVEENSNWSKELEISEKNPKEQETEQYGTTVPNSESEKKAGEKLAESTKTEVLEKEDKEPVEHPNTDKPSGDKPHDKCGDTIEVKTSL